MANWGIENWRMKGIYFRMSDIHHFPQKKIILSKQYRVHESYVVLLLELKSVGKTQIPKHKPKIT